MSGITKKLITGKTIRAFNFVKDNAQGQTLTINNSNGDNIPVIYVEAISCEEGTLNRIVFNKTAAVELGFNIVEV